MVDRVANSPSRIPVAVKGSAKSWNVKQQRYDGLESHHNRFTDTVNKTSFENGLNSETPTKQKESGFETFVMTGDMIIRTTRQQKTPKRAESPKANISPKVPYSPENSGISSSIPVKQQPTSSINTHSLAQESPSIPHDVSAGHVTSQSEANTTLSVSASQIPPLATPEPDLFAQKNGEVPDQSANDSHFPFKEGLSESSIQLHCNGIDVTSDSNNDVNLSGDERKSNVTNEHYSANKGMGESKSAEKIFTESRTSNPLVRTSKSHENYLQTGTEFAIVDINIDDNLAHSIDALTYHDSSDSSLEKIPNIDQQILQTPRSLQNSPERRVEKAAADKLFVPGFINLEEPRVLKNRIKEKPKETSNVIDTPEELEILAPSDTNRNADMSDPELSTLSSRLSEEFISSHDMTGSDEDISLDMDSIHRQPNKSSVDRPSANRLAKRLYHLDGFRKIDVARHLSKKNDFGTLVAEEYLKFFDFSGDTLDIALRKFLKQFSLIGETQERERVLVHFSKRYMECNASSFNSEDACHTLTCAIMLLNTDLHSSQNIGRKMTCSEFIENLAELNDGDHFPKDVLKTIYQAIRTDPIEWAPDDDVLCPDPRSNEMTGGENSHRNALIGNNPFLDLPDPSKTTEYKKGYVMRKCCADADGRKTPLGKRSWKMFYATLRDMVIYLHKDEHGFKKGQLVEGSTNAIRVHHALATKAVDYTKKQYVFRLKTADWAEYLIQTSNSQELQDWIDRINLVGASLSAPPLPGAVSSQKKFQRPLLPAFTTRLTPSEQRKSHEDKVKQLEKDIASHALYPPEKGCKSRIIQDYSDKEMFLQYELKRFNTYVYLLQAKVSGHGELEASIVETSIGELEETGTVVANVSNNDQPNHQPKLVQRSLSDRVVAPSSDPRLTPNGSTFQDDYVNHDTVTTHL